MWAKFISWLLAQPKSERYSIFVWLGELVFLAVIGLIAYWQLPTEMQTYYFLVGLFVLDSVIFFALLRHLPTIRITMLTLIAVLELSTLGYYILSRTVVFY